MTLSWRVPKPPAASNGFLRFRSSFKPAWVRLENRVPSLLLAGIR